jgi:threonine/homoserine/homoserine lactone efflux protein
MLDAQLLVFVAASVTLIVHPGPNMVFVLARAAAGGRKVGLISVAGVGVGQLAHTLGAALGLSAILAQSALAFSVVKYLGAAYLVYLGVKTLLSGRDAVPAPGGGRGEEGGVGLTGAFRQGAASSVLNPFLALFFLSYLPQFVDEGAGAAAPQLLALGLLYTFLAMLIYGTVALFSGAVGERLRGNRRVAVALRWIPGCAFIGLGLRLALSDRR